MDFLKVYQEYSDTIPIEKQYNITKSDKEMYDLGFFDACEKLNEILREHDKQIRAEAIEEYHDKLSKEMHDTWRLYKRYLGVRLKPTFMTAFNMIDVIANQLKESEEV